MEDKMSEKFLQDARQACDIFLQLAGNRDLEGMALVVQATKAYRDEQVPLKMREMYRRAWMHHYKQMVGER
jgi:hypothetical protein